ncbi:hypothetical protein BT96DRAFT_1006158 [Gymnopus androsaceus JB14]|uniref:Uncharacterized protein n=1 Tax=Gymnopus androsaceus JB14 TaxID=1447944 RepID=A0A6A4GLD9_9AGAR|nr:hypothetical protein BT96DRAFT_1006158 [Gymnopus androsaceus JB14]
MRGYTTTCDSSFQAKHRCLKLPPLTRKTPFGLGGIWIWLRRARNIPDYSTTDYSDLPEPAEEPGLGNRGFRVIRQPGLSPSVYSRGNLPLFSSSQDPFVLFCAQGVFQFGNDVIKALRFTSFTHKDFYFIDSSESLIAPPWSVADSDARIIQTTVLRCEGMDWDRKDTATAVNHYFMKPITLDEVLFAYVPLVLDLNFPNSSPCTVHNTNRSQYHHSRIFTSFMLPMGPPPVLHLCLKSGSIRSDVTRLTGFFRVLGQV